MPKGLQGFQKGHAGFFKCHTKEARKKMSDVAKQRPPKSEETRRKISETLKRLGIKPKVHYVAFGANNYFYGKSTAGEKNYRWRGGVTDENKKLRSSQRGVAWRSAVFQRDKFTCQDCGQIGGSLQAHHIKRFSECLDLRFELSNGVTLCRACHKQYGTIKEGKVYKG